ncbi:hypothetical protein A2366_02470 [Candidatus Woesebacteria bacterium RIFOXYB1_FULL_33_9]|uniref:Uncharacterized protein n=1 Tax=Candidatus Woesebacteria bacterium GW2011_GWB1_33_22 TaxID=1618566 RepID=A0A0G0C1B5_9BACT|nr:MAG: hypothetical protein UR35_C0004G0002 [Candidatus Woesebacteria bacterium GW2011_GWB1_33_22]KKP50691.1 MAG: hypothetical protein UR41_C0004G0002 [Candidatus Woesebacteria bacterium GW2011_GWA1_33_33]OGM81103.1 MAG: hypothetical protein A2366_02470 [Candidatus Woesebacteria bacterium RIFOXYB1_FULL_33_9]OGM86829.1 MAG: hypothetical protein A2616_02755 [Candidatus Woesebacteria bacterium RIFOXYD1_FULL_33_11]
METQLPNNVVGLASMFSVIILGIFALISLLDKSLNNRRKMISDADKELITTLQEQVKTLKEKAEGAETRSLNTQMDFEKLKTENQTLREILQGRDATTLEFQKAGMDAIKRAEASYALIEKTFTLVSSHTASIEKLYKAIEKHLATMETNSKGGEKHG